MGESTTYNAGKNMEFTKKYFSIRKKKRIFVP